MIILKKFSKFPYVIVTQFDFILSYLKMDLEKFACFILIRSMSCGKILLKIFQMPDFHLDFILIIAISLSLHLCERYSIGIPQRMYTEI